MMAMQRFTGSSETRRRDFWKYDAKVTFDIYMGYGKLVSANENWEIALAIHIRGD